jgi:hypothetical protein
MRFKINDWVAHQVTVFKAIEPDHEQETKADGRGRINDTARVAYVGRVKKATVTEQGVTYFVAFAPDQNWKQFKESELEDAAIQINPPRMAPPSGHPGEDC